MSHEDFCVDCMKCAKRAATKSIAVNGDHKYYCENCFVEVLKTFGVVIGNSQITVLRGGLEMTREELDPTRAPCDFCGKPYTSACIDIVEIDNYETNFMEFRREGPIRYGCDDHPVQSQTLWRETKGLWPL